VKKDEKRGKQYPAPGAKTPALRKRLSDQEHQKNKGLDATKRDGKVLAVPKCGLEISSEIQKSA